MTRPSRRFLVQQAVLNALTIECGSMYSTDIRRYCLFRFGPPPRDAAWQRLDDFAALVRACFHALADPYEA